MTLNKDEMDSNESDIKNDKYESLVEDKAALVQAEVTRLSQVDEVEYEVQRKEVAGELNISVQSLDRFVQKAKEDEIKQYLDDKNCNFPRVTAWHEEVDGEELLDDIESAIQQYTIVDDNAVIAISLWLVFTWLHNKATVSPILYLTSPIKRCGKSTLLDVIESLSCKPLATTNATPAAMFRSIEAWSPTMIIDEADTFVSRSEDMRCIINSGHYKSKAFVLRCDGEENKPTRFSTWCAKAIAGIGSVPETIMDRAVVVFMKRKTVDQIVADIRHKDEAMFERLCQKIKRWTTDIANDFQGKKPAPVKGINDRANDNWEPLLAIAELAGETWIAKAREAALAMSGSDEETPSVGEILLTDIIAAFNHRALDKMSSVDLIASICADEEQPWSTWSRGKPMTPHELAKLLKPFKLKSREVRFTGNRTTKGFYKADFEDALQRYTIEISATTATTATEEG